MTGTGLAQAIPIAISPILTRIYSPTEFGLAAIYLSCLSVLALVVTGRYELAITLPATDEEAANVVTLTLKLTIIISCILYIPIFIFGSTLAGWLGDTNLAPWFYLLPLSVMVTASFNIIQYWCNRKSQYRTMSVNRVQNTLLTSSFNLLLGFNKIAGGMILGSTLGQAVGLAMIGRRMLAQDRRLLCDTNFKKERVVAMRYADHPKHIAPAQLLGTVAVQIPILMIGTIYSITTLGFFTMAYRMVTLPTTLIANAIGDVYRQRISAAYRERGEFRTIFVSTLKKTIILALLPFSALYFVAPLLYEFVFGVGWRIAGEYAQILVVAAFFQFVFTPIDKNAILVGAARYILIWQAARLFLFMVLYYAASELSIDIKNILWLFVLFNTFLYIIDGVVEYKLSSGKVN